MTDLPEERSFPLINGGELIQTGERILFIRSRPGMIPLLTEPNVEIDDVLDTLFAAQEAIKQKVKALLEQFEINTKLAVRIKQQEEEIKKLKEAQILTPMQKMSKSMDILSQLKKPLMPEA